MSIMKSLKKKLNSFAYNHLWLKYLLDYGFSVIATAISAVIFVFGMIVFLEPVLLGLDVPLMVSGGSSGAAQVIKLIILSFVSMKEENARLLLSGLYLLINIPLLVLAFKGVGKRFALFTLLNVGLVTLFTNIFTGEFFYNVALFVSKNGNMLTRALFAGLCTGLSSAIAYKIDSSAGGFDIVSFYISAKKSTMAGKYGMMINGTIIASFALVNAINTKQLVEHSFRSYIC